MNRRIFIGALGGIAVGLPSVCTAQLGHYRRNAWTKIPSIVVMSAADDSRLPAVYEAVAFWNAVFVNIGSAFRLGWVTLNTDATMPHDELRRLLAVNSHEAHDRIAEMSGDIFVAFSDLSDRSFASRSPWTQKTLVAIGEKLTYLELQNTIAHEFGHAIGLDHSDDATSLMCGGRTQCNFVNVRGGFLQLTRSERLKLLQLYPPGWQAVEPASR